MSDQILEFKLGFLESELILS